MEPSYAICNIAQMGVGVVSCLESSVCATRSVPICLSVPFATSTRVKRARNAVSQKV